MLNEEKIRLMTEIALLEKKEEKGLTCSIPILRAIMWEAAC